ncbi:MAG: QueG-associated DUF1730 domain-containing protein, partial [Candidatus Tumulicola sp.]
MHPNAAVAADVAEIKALAVRTAHEWGAGEVRVTEAFADEASLRRMRDAFARGDLKTWGFDDRYAARSTDPHRLLENARSVVCVAFPYATPPPASPGQLRGRVSNYAWSRDYHDRVGAV